MRITGVSADGERPGRSPGPRRLRKGDRLEARVLRLLAGRLALLEVDGSRLVAWMEKEATAGDWLYLEVLSGGPYPRFRRLTGGGAFWSVAVGSASRALNKEA